MMQCLLHSPEWSDMGVIQVLKYTMWLWPLLSHHPEVITDANRHYLQIHRKYVTQHDQNL